MYKNLAETLRYCAKNGDCQNCPAEWECTGTFGDGLYIKAADAIEELSKQIEAVQCVNIGDLDCDSSQLCTCMGIVRKRLEVAEKKSRWIPVTERLPEDGSLVGKLIADSNGCIRIATQCAEISLSGGKTVYTDLIDLVSFLAKDTPTTEWTDCTHITHWMPLPEPPEDAP